MEGEANQWFQWYKKTTHRMKWSTFVKALLVHFGPSDFEDFAEALSKLRQSGTVQYYQCEFEKLANRVENWPEKALVGCFIARLKDEICSEIKLFWLTTMLTATGLARAQEDRLSQLTEDESEDEGLDETAQVGEEVPGISLHALSGQLSLQRCLLQFVFRFHLLPEFDQGKRSCRRRLAGHNERRRKPTPASLLSSRYARLSSSLHENSSTGSYLMDFTAYPRLPRGDTWPTVRSADRVLQNQSSTAGKFLPHLWQSSSENPPSNVFLQGSAGGTVFPSPGITPGDCFAGVSDSGCALSLLSTQPWGSRNQASDLAASNLMNGEGAPMAQSTTPHGAVTNHFTSNAWSFKGNETSSSSHQMSHALDLGQVSQPINTQFSSELELAQQGVSEYIELGHSRAYGSSTPQVHWSL
ncbi:hypothetical protein HHK36_017696 [Tetracentron sinense]|uniref:SBP-type domain-containing protein n=1 Tax=Tetracentron sinense TaxID=13715 RepID=A0A834YUN6_TETSI|nr:hypothetical protein HHK36_017696 [Tetracentron sinense]